MIDWGAGEYEHTAAELAPVSDHVVSLAGLRDGERVADLACGTGNAALVAARAGARVTGLDGAARLVEVARERAAAEGLDVSFEVGDVQDLPFEDGSLDAVLSVFGVIFAPEPERALSEILRVLRPGGRALLSAWVPAGPIDAMVGAFVRALPAGPAGPPKRFAWHDPDAMGELASRLGAEVELHDGKLAITAESPEAYLARGELHPMSIALRPALQAAGKLEEVTQRALGALRDGNEDPGGFRVHSPYRVVVIRKPA